MEHGAATVRFIFPSGSDDQRQAVFVASNSVAMLWPLSTKEIKRAYIYI